MKLFLRTTDKEIMGIRKEIVLEKGIPVLMKNGFDKSPFKGSDFAWHPSLGYFYELCRVSNSSILETVEIKVIKGDRWIQIVLNAFELIPPIKVLNELNGIDGITFKLPPASSTQMRIHVDDIKGIPLLNRAFMSDLHKLKKSFFKPGLKTAAKLLGARVEKDLTNINDYFNRWYQLHKLQKITWVGRREEQLIGEKTKNTNANKT